MARETDRIIEDLEKQIGAVYDRANFEMQKKVIKELEDYEKDLKKWKKWLKAKKITQEEYDKLVKAESVKISGMLGLQESLAEDCTNASVKAAGIVKGQMPLSYAAGYNYGTYTVEKSAQINTSFSLYNQETVEMLLKDNPKLLPNPRVKVKKEKAWNKKHIQAELLQGILQGESMDDIASRMQNVTNMSRGAAVRNARTSVTNAENSGTLASFKRMQKMGIDVKKKWIATLDGRTRHSHRVLDGEVRDVDETFSNGLLYPADPDGEPSEIYNCRCTLVSELVGFENDDSWKKDKMIDGMSYDEWKKETVKKEDDALSNSVKIKNEVLDNAKKSRFKGVVRDATNGTGAYAFKNSKPISFDAMQSLRDYHIFEKGGNAIVYGLMEEDEVFYANKSESAEILHLKDLMEKRKKSNLSKADDITITPTSTYDRWKKNHDKNFAAWFGTERLEKMKRGD